MGRDFVWGIFSGVRIYVSGKDYFNDDGEVVLKVGGKVASRDVRIVGKYVNGGVYVRINDILDRVVCIHSLAGSDIYGEVKSGEDC